MMWLVRLALNRRYTFVVASLLILILSVVAVVRTPTDIFPDINVPVVSVVWGYTGLALEEMEWRMVTLFERGVTTTVSDVEHIESQSYYGVGVVKTFFPQGADINGAVAQTTAIGQAVLRSNAIWHDSPLGHCLHGVECADFAVGLEQFESFRRTTVPLGR
jgi:multidrug efflux pump subunit AcrB